MLSLMSGYTSSERYFIQHLRYRVYIWHGPSIDRGQCLACVYKLIPSPLSSTSSSSIKRLLGAILWLYSHQHARARTHTHHTRYTVLHGAPISIHVCVTCFTHTRVYVCENRYDCVSYEYLDALPRGLCEAVPARPPG